MLDGFKELLERLTQEQSANPANTTAPRQAEMSFKQAETLFFNAGGMTDLCNEIEELTKQNQELKQQLAGRTRLLEEANRDRSSLRSELSELKDNYAAVKEELKRKRTEPSVDANSNDSEKDSESKKSKITPI